ncbi:TetR/AcrR family transcriptional regulator [Wolbachia endosymbiont of Drosophila chauvacae]|jgi:AcrR family transcriptional regulator|nr:TetR/AcrR family transcriptional regulator [Wolbachia endosymbiont of Drosophila chauvacae]
MPESAQATRTKQALLRAARSEFAAHGLAGGRTDRIAASAGANKQRIYAYFGSKEGLFSAVIEDALDELLGVVPFPTEGDRTTRISDYVTSVATFHREHPELLRLLQWEALQTGTESVLSDDRIGKYAQKVDAFAAAFGLDHDAAAQFLSGTVGLAAWPVAMPQLTRLILNEDLPDGLDTATGWAARAAATLLDQD